MKKDIEKLEELAIAKAISLLKNRLNVKRLFRKNGSIINVGVKKSLNIFLQK